MARLCLCLLLLARAALGTTDAVDLFEGDGISGIARVVKLLEGMSAKLEEEQKADEELKEKFECWCKKNDKDKKAAIAAGKEKVAKLTAAIGELGPRIEELSKQIRTATQEKNANLAALDTANALRAKQSESFKKDEEDLLGQINRVAAAKERMEGQQNATGATGLIQGATTTRQLRDVASVLRDSIDNRGALLYSRLSRADRMEVDDFIANPAPKSNGAMFLQQSAPDFGVVTGILRAMADDFAADLQKELDEEKANQKSYNELNEAKTKELKANMDDILTKTEMMTKSDATLNKSKKSLKVTQKSLAEDIKFQAVVEKRCSGNEDQFKVRMQDRADEMEAISKTLATLEGDEARSLLRKSVSFLQVSSQDESTRARAAGAVLVSAGQKLGAQQMVTLGLRSKIDSFTKVKKAIDDMVSALKAEQKDEIVQRDVCTEDLNKNDMAKQDKNQHKEKVEGDIQALRTAIANYASDIKSITAEISEMQEQVQVAGQTRQKANLEFQTSSDEQTQTQAILEKAVKFLQNVYGKGASSATSFVQIEVHDSKQEPEEMAVGAPEDFKDYKKNAGGFGAVSLVETIIQDSKKLQAEAVADEQEEQLDYEEFVKATGESIKTKTATLKGAQKDKAGAAGDVSEADSDREATIDELDKLHTTEMNLHKECDFYLANFEVRQTARAQEMDALAQAKGILGGADFAA